MKTAVVGLQQEKRRRPTTSGLLWIFALTLVVAGNARGARADEPLLMAHWKLATDARDSSGHDLHATNHGVRFSEDAAVFNGKDAYLEIADSEHLRPGTGDFTISVRVHTDEKLTDVLGDVLSKFQPATRTGVVLSLMNYPGVTNAQSNLRNLCFGIDAHTPVGAWEDLGRPGDSRHVRALCVFDGNLYASTWEPAAGDAGGIYRFQGKDNWVHVGSPDKANAISTLCVCNGKLYAGSEWYDGGGSSLPLSENTHPGGRVWRYDGDQTWTDCGQVDAEVTSVSGLVEFNGELYAGTGTTGSHHPLGKNKGLFRYRGGTDWESLGCPEKRTVHLGVYNGNIYALSYDGGHVLRYDGDGKWTDFGPPPKTTQTYSFMVYQGKMHFCTWPNALLVRNDGPGTWTVLGRPGEEKESMAVSLYNGKLYLGTLPLAQVYRYDGPNQLTLVGRLDHTPDVVYRRAWSMAVYGGRLYCGVLPSGHVFRLEAGKSVTHDRALEPGWRHIAAVKDGGSLRLYVDGRCVARNDGFDPKTLHLDNDQPLRIGFGEHDYFNGKMKDLRVYSGVLSDAAIAAAAR